MSKLYPNYQNKNFYDYVQFVKENDKFFEKIRVSKSIVDDNCPESLNYFKNSGKLHKYYTYVQQEKEKVKENEKMFSKLKNILKSRSSSNYLSNPYSTKLHLDNKYFMFDFGKKNSGEKNFKENVFLDKKIKMSKSNYGTDQLEKDFERIKNYKKLISHKNNLFFENLSPSKAKTDMFFYSNKKENVDYLPNLIKESDKDKSKTTSNNFFKNKAVSKKNLLFGNDSSNALNNIEMNKNNHINNNSNKDLNIPNNNSKSLNIKVVNEKNSINIEINRHSNLGIHTIMENIISNQKIPEELMTSNDPENLKNINGVFINNTDLNNYFSISTNKVIFSEKENNDENICDGNENKNENNDYICNKEIDKNNVNSINHLDQGQIARTDLNELKFDKTKNSSKTLYNIIKENDSFNLNINHAFDRNKSYFFTSTKRIILESKKTNENFDNENSSKNIKSDQINDKIEKSDTFQKMQKLEDIELNDDLSIETGKIISIKENIEDEKKIFNEEPEKERYSTLDKIPEEKVKSEIIENFNPNNQYNSSKEGIGLSEDLTNLNPNMNLKYSQNENFSNVFMASNQNFYSTAVNFNNNNNYFNSSKNILGFDQTNSSNNIFSLTTVNNFPNLGGSNLLYQTPVDVRASNNILNEIEHNEINIKKSKSNLNIKINPGLNLKITKENFKKSKSKNKPNKQIDQKEKEIFELDEGENFKNNIKTVLYSAKAFMEKLNLVDITVYMRNKMLFLEVNPISVSNEKVFILCFERKEDRQMISKIFKNYQSFINNLYYDYPKIEVKTKQPINYVSNWYYKADILKAEAERNKIII